MTIRNLLQLPSLNGATVVAGEKGLCKVVSSISVLEYFDPSVLQDALFQNDEFYGSEIVITGFINVKDDVNAQCNTVRRLAEGGEVGLILFYVGIFMPVVDPRLIRLADELDFTLICMPENRIDLRYSEVIREVMETIFKDQMVATYLVSEMLERISLLPDHQRSMDTVLKMLRDRLACSFVILDSCLSVVNMANWPASGEPLIQRILEFYRQNPRMIPREPGAVTLDKPLCICCREIRNDDVLPMFLIGIKENGMFSSEIFSQASDVVQLFVNMWSSNHANIGTEELIKAILNDEPIKMNRLAKILKADVASIHHMMLIWIDTEGDGRKEFNARIFHKVRAFISSNFENGMTGIYNDTLVAFTGEEKVKQPYDTIAGSLVEELEKENDKVRIVSCLGLEHTTAVRDAYVSCMENLKYTEAIFPVKKVISLQEIKFIGECQKIAAAGEEQTGKILSVLSPVMGEEEQNKELRHTLETYMLDANMSIQKTAEKMFVHKNTVKYRIAKLNERLHYKVSRMPDAFELYRAVALLRLLHTKK
ncbi:PucR family transcriptional regulator [uncultured Robinsoniella sp.]|uniref:PucR family transcriptional regulator n=1 Tax=uncultured Robinsoniella sp. TaxID=904190 RepID=UPI00374F6A8F